VAMADDPTPRGTDEEWFARLDGLQQEITALVKRGKALEALQVALRDPPLEVENQHVKDAAALAVGTAVLGLKDMEVEAAVESISDDEAEVLMKYIYRHLSAPSDKSAAWLRLHALLTARTGPGAIVRVITDQKAMA